MNAEGLAESPAVDGIPAQKLLEGLARLYQLVLVLDGDGHVVWLSNEMGELCSTSAALQVGDDALEIFPDASTFRREFAIRSQLRKHGFLSNMRIEVHNTSGESIPVELSILPISADDAEKPLYVAIVRRVEGEGSRGEDPQGDVRSLAAVLDSAPEAVLAVNERGFITYANPEIERLVGQPPERLVDQPIALLLSNAGEIERLVSSLAPGEGISNQDLTLHRADGRAIQVSASASALREGGRIPRGAVLFLRDVTERRGMQKALESKNVELEHCVHSLAHDLRSPLVALLGFSRLLRQDYGEHLDDTGLHFIDRIEQAGHTMEELIHDLLEFSRIGQGGEHQSMVDPRAVLLQIAAEMKPRSHAALPGVLESRGQRHRTHGALRESGDLGRGVERTRRAPHRGSRPGPRYRARGPRTDFRRLPEPRPGNRRPSGKWDRSGDRQEDRRDPRPEILAACWPGVLRVG